MEKRITHVEAKYMSEDYIKSSGELRDIKIYGTKGAGFSMEINDSSGYCILKEPLKDIEIPDSKVYVLKQYFPSITAGFKEEYYDIIITPHADVTYSGRGNNIRLYQYPNPTITLTKSTSQSGPALSISGGDDIVVSSPTFKPTTNSGIIIEKTQTLTITENPSADGFFYVKDNFNNSLSKNTVITKKVTTEEEPKLGKNVFLKPLTTRTVNDVVTQDIEPDMSVYGKITKNKIVHKSLEVPTCQRATDKFELSDTVGLFKGMKFKVNGVGTFFIMSVDCGKNITIDKKAIIPEGKVVSCDYEIFNSIGKVHTQIDVNGNACVDLKNTMMIVDGMVFSLDDSKSSIKASSSFTGSGTDTVVLTNNITISGFGKKDVTHTLDLDNIITRTPNANDIKVEIPKNSSNYEVKLTKDDFDASTKIITITTQPKHGSMSTGETRLDVFFSGNPDFVGTDVAFYTFSDGTNTSAEKRIDITVK